MKIKVLAGSKNPVKIGAVKEAFLHYFKDLEVIGFDVNSGVSVQPIGDETFIGAKNRALELIRINQEKKLGAKYFVGIEAGIIQIFGTWFTYGATCIIDEKGRTAFGTSPLFALPDSIVKELLKGIELGVVMDQLTGSHNVKQKAGAIGFFTKGVIDRRSLYVNGTIMAYMQFLNEDLFFKK
jgi:inosine/xanthosine triphosphatase